LEFESLAASSGGTTHGGCKGSLILIGQELTRIRNRPTMTKTAPRYYLFSHSSEGADPGRWRFVLRHADGSQHLVAEDVEPEVGQDRLELLTIVRGLEALEQPSCVTLMTPSSYVREGIRRGLAEWRTNGWRWECFGQMVPVKNLDLWQRVDRAMQFHQVDCRTYRIDPPHRACNTAISAEPSQDFPPAKRHRAISRPTRRGLEYSLERIASWLRRRTARPVRRGTTGVGS
jgi:ribonuclease HI